ncbi:MAG: hypothetical protein ACRDOB_09205, partial [Streptosporangiaceae bacterium]
AKTAPMRQWEVARELRARVKAALDAAGVAPAGPDTIVITAPSGSASAGQEAAEGSADAADPAGVADPAGAAAIPSEDERGTSEDPLRAEGAPAPSGLTSEERVRREGGA